jgi:hypothetical protein
MSDIAKELEAKLTTYLFTNWNFAMIFIDLADSWNVRRGFLRPNHRKGNSLRVHACYDLILRC